MSIEIQAYIRCSKNEKSKQKRDVDETELAAQRALLDALKINTCEFAMNSTADIHSHKSLYIVNKVQGSVIN